MTIAHRWLRAWLAAIFLMLSPETEARSLPGFQAVLSDVLPAVVHIQSSERPLRPPAYPNPQQFFFQVPAPQGTKVFPLGTGFLIQARGYCVTSFQVVDGAQSLEIVMPDKRRFKASLVGGDRSLDLALLKWEGQGRSAALDFADSDLSKIGDPVLAIGQGLGFKPFISTGLIAAKGQMLGGGPYDRHFVLDLATHPGNTGGPVIDTRGRVIGMAAHIESLPAQFGFALPSKQLQAAVRDLLKHGKVQRAWLGIVVKSLSSIDSLGEVHDANVRSGLIVENLIVDGPAAQGGLQVGDLLLSAGTGGQKLESIGQLQDLLAAMKSGASLTFKVYRRKEGTLNIRLNLGEVPQAVDLPAATDLL